MKFFVHSKISLVLFGFVASILVTGGVSVAGVIELTDATFDQTIGDSNVPVLVLFYTDWCPYCRQQAPIMDQLADQYADRAKICKLNIEQNRRTSTRFNITLIPTLILFKDGQARKKWVGVTSKGVLAAAIDEVLAEIARSKFSLGTATNLGPTVNSSAIDGAPSLEASGLELYFNSDRPGGYGQSDLWVTTRAATNQPWGAPANLGPTVNSSYGDAEPAISADGLLLYFSSDRPGGYGGWDLWVTARAATNQPWGAPVNLGPTLNSSSREAAPDISADGLEMLFASNRPGGYGKTDIWVSKRPATNALWTAAVNLGPIVNSSAFDWDPSISADGLMLFFWSYRPGGRGGADIWVTTRATKIDPWLAPVVNLGPTNSSDHDTGPSISSDGLMLYFASDRPGGSGGQDLWQVGPEGIVEDLETGDFSKFTWKLSGGANWRISSEQKNSGNYSAQAGSISDDEYTTLEITINCASGDISFYCKVSSEADFDYLKFYIDDSEKGEWSGDRDWMQVSFPVTAGSRNFKWTYAKDISGSAGSDTAWIDDIVFPVRLGPAPPPPGVIELTDANFDQIVLSSNVPVLVDFYTDWCPYCRMQAPIMDELANQYAGRALICKLNIEENRRTATRFGITAIPTLILFKDGQERRKWVGLTSKNVLSAAIDQLL